MGYFRPFTRKIKRGQRFGANPGLGPNPDGGHNGDDHLTPIGTPVHAAGDGVVIFAGEFDSTYADNFGWNLHYGGKMVVLNLDGAEGPYVEYGHLLEYHVQAGDRVRAAQVIALSGNTDGNTGVSTGPHCHVGVLPPNFNLNTSTYGRVNPDLYLTEWPEDVNNGSLSYASESITPLEDELSAAEVKEILEGVQKIVINQAARDDELNAAHHEKTREHDNGNTQKILDREPLLIHRTDELNAAHHVATRVHVNGVRDALLANFRATIDLLKPSADDGAVEAAEKIYREVVEQLGNLKITVAAGGE